MIEPKEETLVFMKQFVPEEYFPVFLEKCKILMDFLYETNKTLNLTRIPEESFWSLHVADSLAFAGEVPLLVILRQYGRDYHLGALGQHA